MNAIRNLFAAFTNLAASLNSLASVIDVTTGRLRQQLAIDEAHALPSGEIIDVAGIPATDGNTPTAKGRNGRKTATV